MIKQAIIPLAGLGTRMLPLTSVIPKELMPINGKPNLEYILDECIDAGINEFIFIVSDTEIGSDSSIVGLILPIQLIITSGLTFEAKS